MARLRSNRQIGLALQDSLSEEPVLPARMFARPPQFEEERALHGERPLFGTEADQVATRVVVKRIAPASSETDDRFSTLATWSVDPAEATALYRRRWEIETLFAALKSRGSSWRQSL